MFRWWGVIINPLLHLEIFLKEKEQGTNPPLARPADWSQCVTDGKTSGRSSAAMQPLEP
jgi:hypothetical protein